MWLLIEYLLSSKIHHYNYDNLFYKIYYTFIKIENVLQCVYYYLVYVLLVFACSFIPNLGQYGWNSFSDQCKICSIFKGYCRLSY